MLSVVAIQPTIRVIDVTHDSHGKVDGSNDKSNQPQEKDEKTGKMKIPEESTKLIALPKHLLQFEIRIPTEDKDLYAYYYLLKVRNIPLCLFSYVTYAFLPEIE